MGKWRRSPVLRVTATTFLLIESGQRDLLVRAENWQSAICAAEIIEIRAIIQNKERRCLCRVVTRRVYETMLSVVDHEDLARLAHGDKVQTLSYLARIYRLDEEEARAVVLELAKVEKEETH
jgi:hypothetical protein